MQVGSIAELDRIVKGSKDKLIVVDYSTTWCGPCKLILPKFEQLAEEYKDAVFLKVRVILSRDRDKIDGRVRLYCSSQPRLQNGNASWDNFAEV